MTGRTTIRLPVLAMPAIVIALLFAGMPASAPASIQVGSSNCPYADLPLGGLGSSALRGSVRCMINEQRTKRGLRALTTSRRLYRAARHHNSDMVWNLGFLTHNSSNGDSATQRIIRYGYTSGASRWSVGEILAYAWGLGASPRAIIRGWLNSTPHRRLMLRGRWRNFGVAGRHGAPGAPLAWGAVYTVDFGWRSG